jgi:prolyl-tRNA synthetase
MLQSQLFYKSKKEAPKEIEAISHQLLYRGDFISQLGSGIYNFLPLGRRVLKKIEDIIRQEMLDAGGQELLMATMHPRAVWEQTGRWNDFGSLFKVKDRHKKDFALAPTHEEVVCGIAKERISSYRDLPQALFQFQTKFRNEIRYTGGLLRTREFLMKDLYSFHADEKDFENYYQTIAKAYFKIFKRCGLEAKMVEASGEGFTSSFTHEFQVLAPVGEDVVVYCPQCDFAQNKEIAQHKAGEKCPKCQTTLRQEKGIEIGNIFPLGDKYSKAFNIVFKNEKGKEKLVIMGCYGIGLGRLMAAIIEINHDEKGIIWPKEVAPFKLHIIPAEAKNEEIRRMSEDIYRGAKNQKIEVLWDDRIDKGLGEKFVESDLLGIPYKAVVNKNSLKTGRVEFQKRGEEKLKMMSIKELLSFQYV